MFREVPGCSGMFHVPGVPECSMFPGFIDDPIFNNAITIKRTALFYHLTPVNELMTSQTFNV